MAQSPLASKPGMDNVELERVLGGFYSQLFNAAYLDLPQCDRIINARIRRTVDFLACSSE